MELGGYLAARGDAEHYSSERGREEREVTLAALAVFGYVKGHFTGTRPVRSAIQTVLIGGIAAGAAFGIARLIS
jgi:hypothetical protein